MPRDLGFYMQTEAVFNVLRENENLKLRSNQSQSRETFIRCHGQNSIKDYLTVTKAESTTMLGSEGLTVSSPSRFRQKRATGFMTKSGQINTVPEGKQSKRNIKTRPQTGVPIASKRSSNMAGAPSMRSD